MEQEFRILSEDKGEPPKKELNLPVKGDKLKVKTNCIKHCSTLELLVDLEVEVKEVKYANLGDMNPLVVYLDDSINTEDYKIIRNPYLLEHFEKI